MQEYCVGKGTFHQKFEKTIIWFSVCTTVMKKCGNDEKVKGHLVILNQLNICHHGWVYVAKYEKYERYLHDGRISNEKCENKV